MEASTEEPNLSPRAGSARERDQSTDWDLVKAARTGSEESARELVARHWDRAHRAAYLITGDRHAAEDVAQEALLRAIQSLRRFEPGRDFAPWVHRIAANAAIDWTRSQRSRPSVLGASDQSEVQFVELETEANTLLASALTEVSPDDRAALVLRYVLDYRAAEIGEILGASEPAVRTRLHRAINKVRQVMEANDG